jgi:hypothetical protein
MPRNTWVNVFDHAFRFGTAGAIQDLMVHSKAMGCKEANSLPAQNKEVKAYLTCRHSETQITAASPSTSLRNR